MRSSRSVVSVLVSFVRSFSTNSRPTLRAASGRPPARQRRQVVPNHVAGARPSRPLDGRRTFRRLVALPPGRLADLVGAIPGSLTRIMEPVLTSPTTTRTPKPGPHPLDPVRHAGLLYSRPLSSSLDATTRDALNRDLERNRGATSGPHPGHERPDRSGQHRSPAAHHLPRSPGILPHPPQVADIPWRSLTRKRSRADAGGRPTKARPADRSSARLRAGRAAAQPVRAMMSFI